MFLRNIENQNKVRIFYALSLAFIALNMVFIIMEIYWFMALPVALLILYFFFFSLDKLLLAIVFLTPFSFGIDNEKLGFAIDLPTEPLIVGVMCLFFLKLFFEQSYDRAVLKHPVTIILMLQLLWMLVTSFTSEIPLVSFKFFLSRLWFVVTFYFVMIRLFKEPQKIRLFLWLFGSALSLIVIYLTIRHASFDFDRKIGSWIVRPFFSDHTNYSAVLALVAPVFIIMSVYNGYKTLNRWMIFVAFLVFVTGIFFSYSRAAWLSLFLAFGAFWILVLKINYKLIFAAIILVVGFLITIQDDLIMKLQSNRQESSQDLGEHLQSVSNISSDASNMERLNRWRAALRMFKERPILGWGPGTYQFVYAPFQLAEDQTIITTNFGDQGNAHSEYLGPLAESGVPGMLLFLTLAIAIIVRGIKNYWYATTKELRLISLGLTLGFITYLSHGLLNNFLDTDKASVPFWGFLAILVAIDVYYIRKAQSSKEQFKEG